MPNSTEQLIALVSTELNRDMDDIRNIWQNVLVNHPLKLFKAPPQADFNHPKMRPYVNFIKEAVEYYYDHPILSSDKEPSLFDQYQPWELISRYIDSYYIDWLKNKDDSNENDNHFSDEHHFNAFILVDGDGNPLQEQLGYLEYYAISKLSDTNPLSALDVLRFLTRSLYDHIKYNIKAYFCIRGYAQIMYSDEIINSPIFKKAQENNKPFTLCIQLPNGAWCKCQYNNKRFELHNGRYPIPAMELKALTDRLKLLFDTDRIHINPSKIKSQSKTALAYSGFDMLSDPKDIPGEQESRVILYTMNGFYQIPWRNLTENQLKNLDLTRLSIIVFARYFLRFSGISLVCDMLNKGTLQFRDLQLLQGGSIHDRVDALANRTETSSLFLQQGSKEFVQPSIEAFQTITPVSNWLNPNPRWEQSGINVPKNKRHKNQLSSRLSTQYSSSLSKENYSHLGDPNPKTTNETLLSYIPPLDDLRSPYYRFIFEQLNIKSSTLDAYRQTSLSPTSKNSNLSALKELFKSIADKWDTAPQPGQSGYYHHLSLGQLISESVSQFKTKHEFIWDVNLDATDPEKEALCKERYYLWLYSLAVGGFITQEHFKPDERPLDRLSAVNFINYLKDSLLDHRRTLTCSITDVRFKPEEYSACLAFFEHNPDLTHIDFTTNPAKALEHAAFRETEQDQYLLKILLSHPIQKTLARNQWLKQNDHINIPGQTASDHWLAAAKYALTYLNNNPYLLIDTAGAHQSFKTKIGQMGVSYLDACFHYLQDYQITIELMLEGKRPDFWIGAYQVVKDSPKPWAQTDEIHYYAELTEFLYTHFNQEAKSTPFFPFGKFILPYSTKITPDNYTYFFTQANQIYPDLDAFVLDAQADLDYEHTHAILQAIDQQLKNRFKTTTRLSIPALDDEVVFKGKMNAEQYRTLRKLYRNINQRIMTACREKNVRKLLIDAKVASTAPATHQQSKETLPFRQKQGKQQHGLEYQHQMTVQQQKEQETIQDNDDALSSQLVTLRNIENFPKILARADELQVDRSKLSELFIKWTGSNKNQKLRFAFHQMTERAFLMLLEHWPLFEDGLHYSNLPQGFHQLETPNKEWVLDYQPLKQRTRVANEFTIRFHTKKENQPLLGHYCDFLPITSEPNVINEDVMQASFLFSSLASEQQNRQALAILSSRFLDTKVENHNKLQTYLEYNPTHSCAFLQLFEDFGSEAINFFYSDSGINALQTYNSKTSWLSFLQNRQPELVDSFNTLDFNEHSLKGFGQVYQTYGIEGVSQLTNFLNELKTANCAFFNLFKADIIEKSTNYCEYLDPGVQTALHEMSACQQNDLWITILQKHSAALNGLDANNMIQLWKAFCVFKEQLLVLNVPLESCHVPAHANMLLWMGKVLEVLRNLPTQERTHILNELDVQHLRHGAIYYHLLYQSTPVEPFIQTQHDNLEEKSDDSLLISQVLSDRLLAQKNSPNQLENLKKVLTSHANRFDAHELRFRAELFAPQSQHQDYPIGLLDRFLQTESNHPHLSNDCLVQLKEKLFNHTQLNRLEQLQLLPLLFIENAPWDEALTALDTIALAYKSTYLNGLEKIKTSQALKTYLDCYKTLFSSDLCKKHPTLLNDWLNALNNPEKQEHAIQLLKSISNNHYYKDEFLVILGRLYASSPLIGRASPNDSYRKCQKIIRKLRQTGFETHQSLSALCADYPIITANAFYRFLKNQTISSDKEALEMTLLDYIGTEQVRRDYDDEFRQEDYNRIAAQLHNDNPSLTKPVLDSIYQRFKTNQQALQLHKKPLPHLKQMLKDAVTNFRGCDEKDPKRSEYQYLVLAILFEIMYRATGKYPKLTQQLSALIRVFSNPKPTIFDIDTGEGKAILMHTLAAYDVLLFNKTVDIIHYKRNLVQRDVTEFKAFYELLEIKSGAVTTGQPRDLKLQVHNGTLSDLRLSEHLLTIQTGEKIPEPRCAKIDESDVVQALEAHMQHKLAIPGRYTALEMAWFYEAIHAFYTSNEHTIFDQNGYVYIEQAQNLSRFLFEQAKDNAIRLAILKTYASTREKQALWLIAADSAFHLKEDTDFILTSPQSHLVHDDIQSVRYMIPIDATTKEPVEGMSFCDGVQQLKITQLNQQLNQQTGVPIFMPVQSVLLSTDVGAKILSTYQKDIEEFSATPILEPHAQPATLRMPKNYPSLREHQGYQIVEDDQYILTLVEIIRTAFKEKRSILFACESNAQAESLYKQVQAHLLPDELDYLMCFTQKTQTAEAFLTEKKIKESQGHSTVVFSAALGRGDNSNVQEIIVLYLPATKEELQQISGRTARNNTWGSVRVLLNNAVLQREVHQLQSNLSESMQTVATEALLPTVFKLRQSQQSWRIKSDDYPFNRLLSAYSSWQIELFGMYQATVLRTQSIENQSVEADTTTLLKALETRLDEINTCWEALQGKDNAFENIQSIVIKHAQNTKKLFATYLKEADIVDFQLPASENNLACATPLSINDLEPVQAPVEREATRRALTVELPFWEKCLTNQADKKALRQAVTRVTQTPALFALWPELSELTTRWLKTGKAKHPAILAFWQQLSDFHKNYPGNTQALATFLPTLLAQSGKLQFELFLSLKSMFYAYNMPTSGAWCELNEAYFEKLTQALAKFPTMKKKELVPLFGLLARRLRLNTAIDFESYDFSLEAMQEDYLATLLTETTGISNEHACFCFKYSLSENDFKIIELSHKELCFYQMVQQQLDTQPYSASYRSWVQTVITQPKLVLKTGYLSFLSTLLDSSDQTTAMFQQLPDELETSLLFDVYTQNNASVIQALQDNKARLVCNREPFKAIIRIIKGGYWCDETTSLVKVLLTLSLDNVNKLSDLLMVPDLQDSQEIRQKIISILNQPACLHKRLDRLQMWVEEPLSKRLVLLEKGIPPALQDDRYKTVWTSYEKLESYLSVDDLSYLDGFITTNAYQSLDACNNLRIFADSIHANTQEEIQLKYRLLKQAIVYLNNSIQPQAYQSYLEAIRLSYEALLHRGINIQDTLNLLTNNPETHNKLHALYQRCHAFSENNTADLLYLLLMRLQKSPLSTDALQDLFENHDNENHDNFLQSLGHRLANNLTNFSFQEQANNQPRNIIYQAARALELNTWKESFQLNDQWQACRQVRTIMMRMMGQDSLLPVNDIPHKETLPFWNTLWDQNKVGDFFKYTFDQYEKHLKNEILPFEPTASTLITKNTLKNHGFFTGEQSKNIYQHAQEIKQVAKQSKYWSVQKTTHQKTQQLNALQVKLLECIDAYSGFFSISPSRRRQRNEIETYIRTYLSQTTFQEQPYIHLMNYLADKLKDAQLLDQAKVHQHSFHKKGYSRLTNMLKTMQDQTLVHAIRETDYDPIAFQKQFKTFADSSNTVREAVLKTLKQTLSHWQPVTGEEQLNQAVKTCKNACDEDLLQALSALNDELVTRTSTNVGKLKHCVSQALYYCQMTGEAETTLGGISPTN